MGIKFSKRLLNKFCLGLLLWVAISEAKAEDTLRLKSTPQ